MSWLLSLVMAGTVAHAEPEPSINRPSLVHPSITRSAAELLAADSRRIRSAEPRIRKLLSEGVRRSKTFADLVSRLHTTDLIVYIETSHDLSQDTVGRILFQGTAGGHRYLRVQVRSFLQGDHVISVLGHELHHALEVAEDSTVIDDASLTTLYRRIGHLSHGTQSYETYGARSTGIRVRDELIG